MERPNNNLGFPGGSDSKACACNAEDLGLIPGLGWSPGEGKGYPLQYPVLENSMEVRGCRCFTILHWFLSPDNLLAMRHKKWKWKWSCSVVSDSLRPMDCSPPSSSVHGILQARILEWVAISFSRRSSPPRDQTQVSHIAGRRFNLCTTREALSYAT